MAGPCGRGAFTSPGSRQTNEFGSEGLIDLCGIVGFTHKDWSPPPDRIRNATSTLIHRGPDQQGVYQSPICSLGATRLKILDLEHGDQPIATEDGDTVIVFNGEIYNHLEVRAELEKLGHRFHTHCDTETVLRAFLQWDTQCFARLRGMFAIAFWTNSTRRLVLARDRMGIKPLYIAHRGEDIFFGSELKAILVHPEIDRRLSLAGLDCYLVAELCSGAVDVGGRHREAPAGTVAGVARRQNTSRCVLESAQRGSPGSARLAAAARNSILCCSSRFASTSFQTFRWACG